jgi:hypothetical protein
MWSPQKAKWSMNKLLCFVVSEFARNAQHRLTEGQALWNQQYSYPALIANLWLAVSQRAYKRLKVNVPPSRPASTNSWTLHHT